MKTSEQYHGLTLKLVNFLNGLIHLPFLEKSIIQFLIGGKDFQMRIHQSTL